jgi:opacity protein-like surface antigen
MRIALSLAVAAVALATPLSTAAAGTTLVGIDGMSATVMQEGQSSFSGLGLRARVQSDRFIPGVDFLPALEYWRNNSTIEPFGIRSSRRDATMAIDARYSFKQPSFTPYLGGGFGIHFLTNEVDAPTLGLNHAQDSVIKGGLSLLGGVGFPLGGRLQNFVELKYHHVTHFRQLKLNWGLAFTL